MLVVGEALASPPSPKSGPSNPGPLDVCTPPRREQGFSGKSQFLIIPIIDDGFFLYNKTLVRAPEKLAEEKHETTIVVDNIEEQNNTTKNDEEQGEINLDGENPTLDQIACKHAKILPREEQKAQSMISHGGFPSLSEISAILTSEKRAIQFMICRGVL